MKDGVYINLYKDISNLFIIKNGLLEDGSTVTLIDYNGTIKYTKNKIIITFNDVKYLGKL